MTKPGWKTTEFVFCVLAFLLSSVLALDVFDAGSKWLQVVGAIGALLTSLGYTVSRTSVKANAQRAIDVATKTTTTLLVLLAATTLLACGASTRQKAIDTGLASLNAARDGFVTFDALHQEQIVAKATTLEEGKAQLAAWREKRKRVVDAFVIAYRALSTAALLNDDQSLAAFITAAATVAKTIDELTGGTP